MAVQTMLKLTSLILVICVVMTAPYAEASMTCGLVVTKLHACLSYLSSGGALSAGCCSGVKSLNEAANNTPDRQAACKCLKTAAGNIPGLNLDRAASLADKCGVSIPYKFSPSMDCSKVT
ncbi:non-specific lipid-transfer protein [Ralstonia pseudosolanacearum]|uniref:non-specific lipid-transfer protein n=1 Tax=Ralstonia pseudosolanacearum TaxID=1310165 RepID=UPI003D1784DB